MTVRWMRQAERERLTGMWEGFRDGARARDVGSRLAHGPQGLRIVRFLPVSVFIRMCMNKRFE